MDIKKCSQKLSIRNSDMVEFHKAQTILRQIGGSQWNLCSSCLHQCLDHRFRKASWEPVFHGEKMMNGKLCDCPVQLFQEHFSSYSSRVHFFSWPESASWTAAEVQLGATPTAPTTQVGFTCSTNVTRSSTWLRSLSFEVNSLDFLRILNWNLQVLQAFANPSMSAIPAGVLGVEVRLTHLKLGGDSNHGSFDLLEDERQNDDIGCIIELTHPPTSWQKIQIFTSKMMILKECSWFPLVSQSPGEAQSDPPRLRELLLLFVAEAAAAVGGAPDEAAGVGHEDGGQGHAGLTK